MPLQGIISGVDYVFEPDLIQTDLLLSKSRQSLSDFSDDRSRYWGVWRKVNLDLVASPPPQGGRIHRRPVLLRHLPVQLPDPAQQTYRSERDQRSQRRPQRGRTGYPGQGRFRGEPDVRPERSAVLAVRYQVVQDLTGRLISRSPHPAASDIAAVAMNCFRSRKALGGSVALLVMTD